jgi:hypothetical protein
VPVLITMNFGAAGSMCTLDGGPLDGADPLIASHTVSTSYINGGVNAGL